MRAMWGTMRAEFVGAGGVVERNIYLTRRYIWWDVAWFVWTVANTLTIVFIAKGVESSGVEFDVNEYMTYLLIGAVVWAYLGILFGFLMETVAWERWEGTIEYTFMAPLSRAMHLAGQGVFAILYGIVRAVFLFGVCALFFSLSMPDANFVAALVILAISSISFIGIGIMTSVLPLISPEKGTQLGFIAQGTLLVVSGVYYPVSVLPDWMQFLAKFSPATYALEGIREAILEGKGLSELGDQIIPLVLIGVISIPLGLWVFRRGELYAKRHGKLKRSRMSEHAVHVDGLVKIFEVAERDEGLKAATKSLVRRKMREVRAVDGISFEIAPGEIVGFLGPNGAGKTTTLKMLSGLLYVSGGEARVLGHVPSKRERDFLRRISLVMGNRNQLQWDLPALDSFELNRSIYQIPRPDFLALRDELIALLDVGDLVRKPVRQLSLGERMKVEIVGSLLHRPDVLFLDEPTIGLDVTMQKRIREFVGEYRRRHGATVMLTSHYMADVEALCERVIVIHHGRILFDGDLAALADTVAAWKTIAVALENGAGDLSGYGEVIHRDGDLVTLRVPKAETARVTARLLAEQEVVDLNVEDPPIEDVIELVFARESVE